MQPGVGKYEDDRDITLYAVWEGDTYTIEYNANANEVSGLPETLTSILKNTDAIISTKQPVRTGYDFVGWSTDKYLLKMKLNMLQEQLIQEKQVLDYMLYGKGLHIR